MRFDDSLKTVLSADATTDFGAQSTWRQLVDLIGRGKVAADAPTIARLRLMRQAVPETVRAASARALAFAAPPAALVGLFADEPIAIAAPVLRTATLDADAWEALLPQLTPAARSILRHRRDLPDAVVRALETFGATDFVLSYDGEAEPAPVAVPPLAAVPPADTPLSETPFLALGVVARGLPVVAEALRQAEARTEADAAPARFEIADLVARIDAFKRERASAPPPPPEPVAEAGFRYETDSTGTIRWVEGVTRTALVGLSLAHAGTQGLAQIDGIAPGAFRRRSTFSAARLEIGGQGDAAGSWRVSGVPAFDSDTGRFLGLRGSARRPRPDESAAPLDRERGPSADSLRQLVHELRTPANAIAGFAELIEMQLVGPVPDVYRDQAATIRSQASALIGAIEDLDTAARIEGGAMELRPTLVPVLPLLDRVLADLIPLARIRGAVVAVDPASAPREIAADDRAVERLLSRLLAALVSNAVPGERIGIAVAAVPADSVAIAIDRPAALAVSDRTRGGLYAIEDDIDAQDGAPLLGTGFALRLAQNLAAEIGGSLTVERDRLLLRLPATVAATVRGGGQVIN